MPTSEISQTIEQLQKDVRASRARELKLRAVLTAIAACATAAVHEPWTVADHMTSMCAMTCDDTTPAQE